MPSAPLPADRILALLAETPRRLIDITDSVPAAALRTSPQQDEWSANDVLAHLRSCADVWGGCIATILAADEPTLRAVNPRTHIERTDYLGLEFGPSLAAFVAQRQDLLAVLERLRPGQWSRAATVTGAGRALRRTVLSYAEWLATHERPHVKQIDRAIATVRTTH